MTPSHTPDPTGSRVLKAVLLLAAGLVIGGLFLWLALRTADLSRVRFVLGRAQLVLILPLLAALGASFAAKAWRWQVLLSPFGHIAARRLLAPTVVAYAGNILLPFYLGEAFRVAPVARALNSSVTGVLSSLVAERTLDLAALLILAVALTYAAPAFGATLSGPTHVLLAIGGAGATVIVLCCHAPRHIERFLRWLTSPLPVPLAGHIMAHAEAAMNGLQFARNWGTLLRALALSLLQWGLLAACVLAALAAVHIHAPKAAAAAILVLAAIGMSLPSSPGFVGTIQLAFVLGLAPFGTPREPALAASIYYHVVVNVSILVAGALLWPAVALVRNRRKDPR